MPTTPLARLTVVRIDTGQKVEMAKADDGNTLYHIRNLRKDGRNNEARTCDAFLATSRSPGLHEYAPYDADREAKATPIRARIAELKAAVSAQERSLLSLYVS